MAIVAAAGPGANLLMAIGWALIIKVSTLLPMSAAWVALPFRNMGEWGVDINIALMILNLIPIPPLDGGRVAVGLLPGPLAWQLSRLEPYGFFILLGLLATGTLSIILSPPIMFVEGLVAFVTGLSAR